MCNTACFLVRVGLDIFSITSSFSHVFTDGLAASSIEQVHKCSNKNAQHTPVEVGQLYFAMLYFNLLTGLVYLFLWLGVRLDCAKPEPG